MKLFKIFQRNKQEKRNDSDSWWSNALAASSGVDVTPDSAMGTSAVYAVVTAIAQTIGSLPLIVYERTENDSRKRVRDHPYAKLLNEAPNNWMTPDELINLILLHGCVRGNAYLFPEKDKKGLITSLIPLSPNKIDVEQLDNNELIYKYYFKNGGTQYLPSDILHFRFGITDGVVGRSPISTARDPIGLTIALEQYAGRFFANSATPSGIITHPHVLSKEAADRMRASWKTSFSGRNQQSVAVFEEGVKFEPITMSSADAQFVEQRRFQVEEMCRLYRVPPHIVGDLSRATFSNIEHQGISYTVNTLSYYLKRVEAVFNKILFKNTDYYCEFLVDALLRGDVKSRSESYEIQRRNGVLSANEWRKRENMPEIGPDGDKYMIPMNMTWSDLIGKQEPKPEPQPEVVEPEPKPEKVTEVKKKIRKFKKGK